MMKNKNTSGARGGNMLRQKKLPPKALIAVDALICHALITGGNPDDCKQAAKLIDCISAEHLLADKGYHSGEIINRAEDQDIMAAEYHQNITEKINMIRSYISHALIARDKKYLLFYLLSYFTQ